MEADTHSEAVGTFVAVTGADPATAEHVLDAHNWDLSNSINWFLETVNPFRGASNQAPATRQEAWEMDREDEALQQALAESMRTAGVGPDEGAGPSIPDFEADEVDGLRTLANHRQNRYAHDMDIEDDEEEPGYGGMARGFLDRPAQRPGARPRRTRPTAASAADADGLSGLQAVGRGLLFPPAPHPVPFQPMPDLAAAAPYPHGGDEDLQLPDGINVEEARMLEAAMLGIPYAGRMPDFSPAGQAAAAQAAAEANESLSPSVHAGRRIREEQDAAYYQSLRADQEKMQAAEETRRQAELAERQKREEEESAAAAQREAEAEAARKQRRLERQLKSKAQALPGEPPCDHPDALTVMVRMPNGSRISRRFVKDDPLQALFDYVAVEAKGSDIKPGSFNLVTQFPRKVLSEDTGGSLRDAGLLQKQEAVLIEMLVAQQLGLNAVRTWAFNDGQAWNALQPTPGQFEEAVFQALDYVVEKARSSGMRVLLTLTNYLSAYGGVAQYVQWASGVEATDFYTSAAIRQQFKTAVRALILRRNTLSGRLYRDDDFILGWDLCNECEAPGDLSGDILQSWVEDISSYVKQLDPNHLVTLGVNGWFGASTPDRLSPSKVRVFGCQQDGVAAAYDGVCQGQDFVRLFQAHIQEATRIGKPLILGEFGGHRPMRYRNGLYQAIYVQLRTAAAEGLAVAGTFLWMIADASFQDTDGYTVFDEARIYPHLAPAGGYQVPFQPQAPVCPAGATSDFDNFQGVATCNMELVGTAHQAAPAADSLAGARTGGSALQAEDDNSTLALIRNHASMMRVLE
ncbi:hypothetical protein WJX72_002895 [[Myrmecia] bisecta]|uniref:mannan endo-1,4-beta-mannosidase n=1 Tax=[Myrmecia] bisecta TaxID=41462 RepID=A0AAW1QA58_9CHLO